MPITVMPGSGQGLDPLISALIQREQNKAEKDRIKIAQDDLALRQAEAAEAAAARQQEMQGLAAAAQFILSQNPQMAQAAAGLQGPAMGAFLQNTQGFQQAGANIAGTQANTMLTGAQTGLVGQQTLTEGAQAVSAQVDANVNVATERARIMQEFEQANGMSLQNALLQAQTQQDPQRVARAWDLMQTGELSAGQAFDAAGATLPTSITREFRLNPLTASGSSAGGESAAKAASLFGVMKASNDTINTLVDDGVRLGLASSWHRSSTNWLTSWTSGIFVDEEQRRVIQAQKQFADAYRFFISGQQSSDKEAERLLFTILENPGDFDKPDVVSQKRFMRQLVIGMAEQVAGGRINPLQAAQNILNAAIQAGLPEEQLNVFREQVADASEYVARGGPGAAAVPSSSGGSVSSVPDLIDSALR